MIRAPWQRVYGSHRNALQDHSRLMFVACSESRASAKFLAAFPTAYVLQTLAGPPRLVDASTRAALAYGAVQRGIRQVVVCGHGGCRGDGEARTSASSHALIAARCRALREDELLGPILRDARPTLRPLWFDEISHDIYACDVEGGPSRLMGDDDLAALFTQFDQSSA